MPYTNAYRMCLPYRNLLIKKDFTRKILNLLEVSYIIKYIFMILYQKGICSKLVMALAHELKKKFWTHTVRELETNAHLQLSISMQASIIIFWSYLYFREQ